MEDLHKCKFNSLDGFIPSWGRESNPTSTLSQVTPFMHYCMEQSQAVEKMAVALEEAKKEIRHLQTESAKRKEEIENLQVKCSRLQQTINNSSSDHIIRVQDINQTSSSQTSQNSTHVEDLEEPQLTELQLLQKIDEIVANNTRTYYVQLDMKKSTTTMEDLTHWDTNSIISLQIWSHIW